MREARGAEHQEVPRLLGSLDLDLRTHLSILRRLRNAADYDTDLSAETILRSARDARAYAESILTTLDHLRSTFTVEESEPHLP
jgi:hypothetical protein